MQVGIYYGPQAICLGVPGGSLAREGTTRIYSTNVACVAAQCKGSGDSLEVLIKDQDGDGYSAYDCPEGEFVELGSSEGFPSGVRVRLLICSARVIGCECCWRRGNYVVCITLWLSWSGKQCRSPALRALLVAACACVCCGTAAGTPHAVGRCRLCMAQIVTDGAHHGYSP